MQRRKHNGQRPHAPERSTRVSEAKAGIAPKTRLFLVDDHPLVRHGLQLLFSLEPDLAVCGEAEGEHQALRRIVALQPDLAVVDLSLKEGSGLSLIARLRQVCPRLKILVFSMCDGVSGAAEALRKGAHAFLTKDEGPEAILKAVHSLAHGSR